MSLHGAMKNTARTGLVIVDVQKRLMAVMRRGEHVVGNIVKLLHLARHFQLPVLVTEQYPRMLGPTRQEIKRALPGCDPVPKMDFDCCAAGTFIERLREARLRTVFLSGVETHVCILQTCTTLLQQDYIVQVPQDAVDSRTEENWQVGLSLMREEGAVITSTETIVFEFLKRAGTREFKEMMKIIK